MEFTNEEKLQVITQRAKNLYQDIKKARKKLLDFEPGVIKDGEMGHMKIEEYNDLCRSYVHMIDILVTYESFIQKTRYELKLEL